MLSLASFQKLKSNTSDSVRLLTCYFTPYTISIFKISPMSEIFKVPPYKVSNFPGLLLNVVGMGTTSTTGIVVAGTASMTDMVAASSNEVLYYRS